MKKHENDTYIFLYYSFNRCSFHINSGIGVVLVEKSGLRHLVYEVAPYFHLNQYSCDVLIPNPHITSYPSFFFVRYPFFFFKKFQNKKSLERGCFRCICILLNGLWQNKKVT